MAPASVTGSRGARMKSGTVSSVVAVRWSEYAATTARFTRTPMSGFRCRYNSCPMIATDAPLSSK